MTDSILYGQGESKMYAVLTMTKKTQRGAQRNDAKQVTHEMTHRTGSMNAGPTAGRRRRGRRRRRMISGTIVLLLAVLAAWLVLRCVAGDRSPADGLSKRIATKFKAAAIDRSQYPQQMLEALDKNEELLDFVMDYPDKKGTWAEEPQLDLSQDRSIPLFLQWDEQWGYAPYGDGIIGLDGCGPTCLSMVYVGLTGDTSMHPRAMADYSAQNGYLTDTGATQWALMTTGAQGLGLQAWEISLSEESMAQELAAGHPIICSMRPGDFTTKGHFIVLYAYEDGLFYVNDPNSRVRSDTGFDYSRLSAQIKALWAFSK